MHLQEKEMIIKNLQDIIDELEVAKGEGNYNETWCDWEFSLCSAKTHKVLPVFLFAILHFEKKILRTTPLAQLNYAMQRRESRIFVRLQF